MFIVYLPWGMSNLSNLYVAVMYERFCLKGVKLCFHLVRVQGMIFIYSSASSKYNLIRTCTGILLIILHFIQKSQRSCPCKGHTSIHLSHKQKAEAHKFLVYLRQWVSNTRPKTLFFLAQKNFKKIVTFFT